MKVITTGLLNRFWTKGIKPWLDKRIKSYADLMVTTASGYTPDALAVKEGFTELNGKLTIALPSESSIRSLDNKIRITEYKGRLVIQLSIDQSKDWYAMLSFDQTGLSYIKNDSDGYVSKKIV